MTLATFVERQRLAILGVVGLLIVMGLFAGASMPVSIFPEIAFHRIGILARNPSLPVEQTVTQVTQPLESALAGVQGVETVRSETTRGGVQLDVRFGWTDDMLRAQQYVQAALEEARATLPPGTEIESRLLDTSAFPVLGVALTSELRTLAEVSDLAIYEAAPLLRTIPGVYRVELSGAKVREYAITVDPAALGAYRLDLGAVETAVRSANGVGAAGLVSDGPRLTLAVVNGGGADLRSLLDVPVPLSRGGSIALGSLARLDSVVREDFTRAAADGKPAVLLGVSRQPRGNTAMISQVVSERLTRLARAHPDMRFSVFYDQANLVQAAGASVRDSILIGLGLAIATIFFFVADLRSTFVGAVVVPATVLLTVIAMSALGMTFNLMTLGGIAAGIGLVLDDAIVVIENFHRHRLLGEAPADALSRSTSEIAAALVGSTITPVAVLLPLALLGELPGAFFRPLAITMSIALLTSLALALTFTPALVLATEPAIPREARPGPGDRFAGWLTRIHARLLRAALSRTLLPLAATVALGLLAVLLATRLESGFVPAMDEGAFILDYWAPAGTSVDETVRMLETVDGVLRETPEVTAFSRRTGAELGFFLTDANRGDYSVRLKSGRRRGIEEVIADVRTALSSRAPGLRVEFVEILQDMIGDLSGTPSPVEIKLFGPDHDALERTARAGAAAIERVPGVVDVFDGITEIGPTYRVAVDPRRAALAGLDRERVQHWLETAVTGTVVGQVLEGDRSIPLRLRYPDQFRSRLDEIPPLALIDSQGKVAPLRSIAELSAEPTGVKRERENLRQLVRVTARLENRDLGSALQEIRDTLRRDLALPPGATLEYGGLYASQQRAFADLAGILLLAIGSVSAVLLVEFASFAAAFAIVVCSGLAITGSVIALWLAGQALNVSSVVGMIMVVGIVAKNGILILDFTRRTAAEGASFEEALLVACRTRLRPILMTSLAAAAGLTPLALGIGAGSEMHQPLAIAILGGLAVSFFFSLLALPVLYRTLTRPARSHS